MLYRITAGRPVPMEIMSLRSSGEPWHVAAQVQCHVYQVMSAVISCRCFVTTMQTQSVGLSWSLQLYDRVLCTCRVWPVYFMSPKQYWPSARYSAWTGHTVKSTEKHRWKAKLLWWCFGDMPILRRVPKSAPYSRQYHPSFHSLGVCDVGTHATIMLIHVEISVISIKTNMRITP